MMMSFCFYLPTKFYFAFHPLLEDKPLLTHTDIEGGFKVSQCLHSIQTTFKFS
jgi:hypothetical protein